MKSNSTTTISFENKIKNKIESNLFKCTFKPGIYSLLGLVLGDSIGSPFEMKPTNEIKRM
jgi:hypothetical protein